MAAGTVGCAGLPLLGLTKEGLGDVQGMAKGRQEVMGGLVCGVVSWLQEGSMCARVLAVREEEGCLAGGRLGGVVVGKLGGGEVEVPICLAVAGVGS